MAARRVVHDTITDRNRFFEEIKEIRRSGYAINDEESQVGLRAVAAAISNPLGKAYGAISIAGPTYSITDDRLHDTWAPAVTEATDRVEETTDWAHHSQP